MQPYASSILTFKRHDTFFIAFDANMFLLDTLLDLQQVYGPGDISRIRDSG